MCRGQGAHPSPLALEPMHATATASDAYTDAVPRHGNRQNGAFAKQNKGRSGLHKLTATKATADVTAGLCAAQKIIWGCVPPAIGKAVKDACGEKVLQAAFRLHTAAIGGRGNDRAFRTVEARDRYLGDYLNCEEISLHRDCREQAAGIADMLQKQLEISSKQLVDAVHTRCLQVRCMCVLTPPAKLLMCACHPMFHARCSTAHPRAIGGIESRARAMNACC